VDILFQDPEEIPLPKQEVRIRALKADPWPDGQRVRVYVETDPFQYPPNLDLTILAADNRELSSISIIESMTRKMEMTMHVQEPVIDGSCQLRVSLFYYRDVDEGEDSQPGPNQPMVVDHSSLDFTLPARENSAGE
jgi:hypothetical protein